MVRSRCPEIETVLRKFNPWEQNLEISSPSLTSHGKLGLLTQGRGEGQRTEADERTRTADFTSLRVSKRAFTAIPDCTEIGIDPQLVRHTCTPTTTVVETSCRQCKLHD